ncbi:hypothetical protein [Janthinobacterium sp. RB2R34]|uniref:hypothetical protein n=1 Tax=Janthinobacterium sp. RB2R34 TaxID=3424193 RepID=UPI003F279DBF
MIIAKWQQQEVPDVNGLIDVDGALFTIGDKGLGGSGGHWDGTNWLNVAILAQVELHGGKYLVKCGEAMEHGSAGVVVLESVKERQPVWIFVSDNSNPFDQIVVKGGWVLVLSSTGAVLRFASSHAQGAPPHTDIFYYGTLAGN